MALTDHRPAPNTPNTASWVYNVGSPQVFSLGVAWSCKDKDSKSVHGLTDHRPSPNTASWVYNVGSPQVLHGHVKTNTVNQYMV